MFCFFDVRFLDYTSPFNQVVLILGVSQLRSYYRPLVCNDSHLLRPRLSTREAALSILLRIPLLLQHPSCYSHTFHLDPVHVVVATCLRVSTSDSTGRPGWVQGKKTTWTQHWRQCERQPGFDVEEGGSLGMGADLPPWDHLTPV